MFQNIAPKAFGADRHLQLIDVVKVLDSDILLLETDVPYVSPSTHVRCFASHRRWQNGMAV